MDDAYTRLRARLTGLTDDEFFWQPAADAWTIYEDRPGHWTYHYAIPDPEPAPLTTIGWQVVHEQARDHDVEVGAWEAQ